MTDGHCMRDHGTGNKNNFDIEAQNRLKKGYHRSRRCVLSLHSLLPKPNLFTAFRVSFPRLLGNMENKTRSSQIRRQIYGRLNKYK